MRYTLVEEQSFATARNALGTVRSIDEAMDGVTWAMARDPYVYDLAEPHQQIDGADVYIAKTDTFRGIPRLAIWFTVVDVEVRLQFIMIFEDEG